MYCCCYVSCAYVYRLTICEIKDHKWVDRAESLNSQADEPTYVGAGDADYSDTVTVQDTTNEFALV